MSAPERIWVRAHEAFDEDPGFPPSFGDVPQYIRADLADDSPTLPKLIEALGWQGGTVAEALAEVRRLKKLAERTWRKVGTLTVTDHRQIGWKPDVEAILAEGFSVAQVCVPSSGVKPLGQGVAALLPDHGEVKA